jgi:hypothetical protein
MTIEARHWLWARLEDVKVIARTLLAVFAICISASGAAWALARAIGAFGSLNWVTPAQMAKADESVMEKMQNEIEKTRIQHNADVALLRFRFDETDRRLSEVHSDVVKILTTLRERAR